MTWAERINKAWESWNHWHFIPGRFRMDRVFKDAGVRALIVERDRYRRELEKREETLRDVSAELSLARDALNLAEDECSRYRRQYEEFLAALTAKLNAAGVPATPSWPDAIDYVIRELDACRCGHPLTEHHDSFTGDLDVCGVRGCRCGVGDEEAGADLDALAPGTASRDKHDTGDDDA